MRTKIDYEAEVGRLERERDGILRDKLHFEREAALLKKMHAKQQERANRLDRLWVGPERQAVLEREFRDHRVQTITGTREIEAGYKTWTDVEPMKSTAEVVLGVDGRWRWTQDMGIEPR